MPDQHLFDEGLEAMQDADKAELLDLLADYSESKGDLWYAQEARERARSIREAADD